MNTRKGLVLDANILIRAVMGRRVRSLLEAFEGTTDFYAADVCFDDAAKYIPGLLIGRGQDPQIGSLVLEQIQLLVTPVDRVHYQDWEQLARERVAARDADDWPVAAVALLLDVPIWTEDQDFFGSGIATWTTDRVEVYLKNESPPSPKRS
jgi:predicted nucleic acid-binding protein